jgi:hypothetical protein
MSATINHYSDDTSFLLELTPNKTTFISKKYAAVGIKVAKKEQ